MRIIILYLMFFMGIAVWADSKFILFQLKGLDRRKVSVHRTLRDCLDAGKSFQSSECFQIWKRPKRKTPGVEEQIRQNVMNICNQEGK